MVFSPLYATESRKTVLGLVPICGNLHMLHVDIKLLLDKIILRQTQFYIRYVLWSIEGFWNHSVKKIHGSPKPMGINKLWVVEGMG